MPHVFGCNVRDLRRRNEVERGGTRWNEVGLGKPDLPRLIFLAQDPLANCEASWSRAIADSAGANSVHHCCPSRGGVGWGWGQFAETNKKNYGHDGTICRSGCLVQHRLPKLCLDLNFGPMSGREACARRLTQEK